jgi:hypothetical protein
MGFQEGNEDESLLTCVVCQSPLGMTSRFCGECGSSRAQALGVERARPSQRIKPVEAPHREPIVQDEEAIFSASVAAPSASRPRKPSRWSNLRVSISMRIETLWFFMQYHARKFAIAGATVFLVSSYVLTQTLIFLGASPADTSNAYITAVSARNAGYFTNNSTLTPELKKVPLLPVRFNNWPEAQTASWINLYSWNGWSSSAKTSAEPGATQPTMSIPLVAKSTSYHTIFRNKIWILKGPMATVTISYPSDNRLPIYINGVYAGTVGNPALKAGKYYAMPGPFAISFASNGKRTNYDANLFIDASGDYNSWTNVRGQG